MSSSTPKWTAWLIALTLTTASAKQKNEGYAAPDSLLLKSGRLVEGVIINNTADAVWIQKRYGISKFPKSEITRIRDAADVGMEFTATHTKGDLPAWRVMVNDIRNNDQIKSLEQIPATAIDNGLYKNVPYLSFRLNELMEMNIYGDPDDPAAIEFGAYGRLARNDKMRQTLRAFLAGFLATKEEIAAIYSVPFSGGEKCVDTICFKVIPVHAPDSYGGWWISIYNPGKLTTSRMDDEKYTKLTRPPEEVIGRGGALRRGTWSPAELLNIFKIQSG
jgi:hypothetical protein